MAEQMNVRSRAESLGAMKGSRFLAHYTTDEGHV